MSIESLVIIGIIFISILLAIVLLMPSEKNGKKKRRQVQGDLAVDEKVWAQKVSRLEKHIHSLRNEILNLQNCEKDRKKQLMVEGVKVKKLQEKLSQERQWHEKEKDSIDKRGKELQKLKSELIDIQESYSKAHSANLRYKHQVDELQAKTNSLKDKCRKSDEENNQLMAKVKNDKQEIAQLKKENIQLAKKKEDINWIAKTEYERVTKLLKQTEKELTRVTRK